MAELMKHTYYVIFIDTTARKAPFRIKSINADGIDTVRYYADNIAGPLEYFVVFRKSSTIVKALVRNLIHVLADLSQEME